MIHMDKEYKYKSLVRNVYIVKKYIPCNALHNGRMDLYVIASTYVERVTVPEGYCTLMTRMLLNN
jgi:hypothetical protein